MLLKLYDKNNNPQDLQRIYQVFPMSERILFEYNNKKQIAESEIVEEEE